MLIAIIQTEAAKFIFVSFSKLLATTVQAIKYGRPLAVRPEIILHLEVSFELADVVLSQEVFLQGEAAVLVIKLG